MINVPRKADQCIRVDFTNAILGGNQFVEMDNCVVDISDPTSHRSRQQCVEYWYVAEDKAFGA